LGLNLFAATLAINRKILLKDTVRKLSHFDNQFQSEGTDRLEGTYHLRRLAPCRHLSAASAPERKHDEHTTHGARRTYPKPPDAPTDQMFDRPSGEAVRNHPARLRLGAFGA
jgi:hypothetical protein